MDFVQEYAIAYLTKNGTIFYLGRTNNWFGPFKSLAEVWTDEAAANKRLTSVQASRQDIHPIVIKYN
jgi:hypothetical protein